MNQTKQNRRRAVSAGLLALALSATMAHASGKKLEKPAKPGQEITYTLIGMGTSGEGFGPIDPNPPSVPVEQITAKVAQKEDEFERALAGYTYQRTVREQTLDDNNKVDGEYFQVVDVSFDTMGKRTERVKYAPANSLERVVMTQKDFDDVEHRLPFVLTSDEIGLYNLNYVGRQKVDDLDTYIFDVAPKEIEKNKRYFQGRVWVDQRDFQVVLSNGKSVPDKMNSDGGEFYLPFITYRQQIDGKYWFPVYTKSDAIVHLPSTKWGLADDIHMKVVVRYENYQQFGSTIKVLYNGEDITNKGDQPQGGTGDKK